jgi:transposase InsO family protein
MGVRKKLAPEQIIGKLRQAEVLLSKGASLASERHMYRALGQPRSMQRYQPIITDEETRLMARIIELTNKYGQYGYRMITGLLKNDGWKVNHKRIERIWRQEGLTYRRNSRSVEGSGLMTAPASDSGLNEKTTYGAMISRSRDCPTASLRRERHTESARHSD